MQSVFDVVEYALSDDPYEPDYDYSWGLAATLAEAVAFIAKTVEAGEVSMTVESEDGNSFVRIIERAVGLFEDYPSGKDPRILAHFDWRGQKLEIE